MRIVMLMLIAVAAALPAAAQERLKEVWVTQSDSGTIVRGTIVTLSAESLTMLTAGEGPIELPLSRVLRIETRGDSLKNGAIIGAAVMAGLAVFGCQGMPRGAQCAAAVGFNTGFGALVGAGVDALNGGRTTLYSRAPDVSAGKAGGVQLRLRF